MPLLSPNLPIRQVAGCWRRNPVGWGATVIGIYPVERLFFRANASFSCRLRPKTPSNLLDAHGQACLELDRLVESGARGLKSTSLPFAQPDVEVVGAVVRLQSPRRKERLARLVHLTGLEGDDPARSLIVRGTRLQLDGLPNLSQGLSDAPLVEQKKTEIAVRLVGLRLLCSKTEPA